jgi:hypothetical protein
MHQFGYQLTITCTDEDCSEEGEVIFSMTASNFDGLEEKYRQMVSAEDKHIEAEEEYREWNALYEEEDRQERAMDSEREDF